MIYRKGFTNTIKAIPVLLLCVFLLISGIYSVNAEETVLAFPGAEGGGKYATGARGNSSIEVYRVTNLNPSGEGSLAEGVKKAGRIIVFEVGGTIELTSQLKINRNNITILGQTAPGDGITLTGEDVLVDDGMENVIIRYLRIRPTDKHGGEPDGLGGRWNKNVIIDHCSVSWSVDELLTLYAGSSENDKPTGRNLTIQNVLASESLAMSNHVKGKHGYGGIFGGTDSTFYHNLLAHHDSRVPRLDRELGSTDIVNNVIYNWGQTNSAYGGEPYSYSNKTQVPSNINYVSNYYKFGPSTKSKIKSRIFDVSNDKNVKPYSNFYFMGNYVYGDAVVTADNTKGVNSLNLANLLTEPVDMGDYTLPNQTAEQAYDDVLSDVGATLPKRDAIDARIIDDVRHQTGRIINSDDEVGGLISTEPSYREFEIPESWKTEKGMGTAKETDIIPSGEYKGYTWIEAYVNDWTAAQQKPTNPEIVVLSPATASVMNNINGNAVENGNWTVINEGESFNYHAIATPNGQNEITKVELYDSTTLIKTYDQSEVNDNIFLDAGIHYLTCRAYNTRNEKTQSTTAIVYVKSAAAPGSYSYSQIGTGCAFENLGGASLNNKGVYTVSGSGLITTNASDKCAFMYKEVSGDFDITTNIYDVPRFENGQVSGLMLRESLNPNAKMVMLADGWDKYGENVFAYTRNKAGAKSTRSYFKNISGAEIKNSSSYDSSAEAYRLPKYMRMTRKGDTITLFVSDSGQDFTDNPRQPMTITVPGLSDKLYIGIANDSAQGTSTKEYFSMAGYRNLTLNGVSDTKHSDLKLPVYNKEFDLHDWYGVLLYDEDLSAAPISGNSGRAMSTWLYANRSFLPQSDGRVIASFDSLSLGGRSGKCNYILRGLDANDKLINMVEVIAEPGKSFVLGNTELDGLTVTADIWYNVTITLDYDTSEATVSIYPYDVYDSAAGKYKLSDIGSTGTTTFNSTITASNIRFVREGGTKKYFDNVLIKKEGSAYISVNGDKVAVFAPQTANFYLAYYDKNEILVDTEITEIPAKQEKVFEKVETPVGGKVKAYLWDENMQPLCDSVDIE